MSVSKSYPTGSNAKPADSLKAARDIINQTEWDVYKVEYEVTIFKTQQTHQLHMPIAAKDTYEARQQAIQLLERDYKSLGTVKIISVRKVS